LYNFAILPKNIQTSGEPRYNWVPPCLDIDGLKIKNVATFAGRRFAASKRDGL
jgi:hypothetical protein